MADRVIELLKSKYLISPIRYEGLQRIENLEIPEDALREAIFNSIIHKDYTGAHIQMKVWDDRVELWNEGGLPFDMSIDNLLENHSSKPRNVNIASVFYKAGFIESWGRGILKIQKGFEDAGLNAPVFEEHCGGILVTMYRQVEDSKTKEKNQGETKEKVLEMIRDNPHVTQREMREALDLSQSGIEYQMKKLKEAGTVERIGGDRGGYWKITE